MLIGNKKERTTRSWICIVLVLCMLLGQFPAGVTANDAKTFNITGIKAYNFRGSDWYIILQTDHANFSLSNVVSLANTGVTVDGAATTGWFQKTTGTLAFDLDTDKAEHEVIIPAGTVLGEYVLENDYVFYTHANGAVDNKKPVDHVNITGIKAYNYRVNNNDWYIVLNVDKAAFSLSSTVSLDTTGVTVDGAATTGWFQATTGTLEFNIVTDKAEHEVIIPAGTVLGAYVLEKDYVFYTHADGAVDNEKPANYVNITGIQAYNFRVSNNDWYIILNVDNAAFSLFSPIALNATIDGVAASGWFQAKTGTLEFNIKADKAEHEVIIPAGTVLGEYVLEKDYVFYTHADGTVNNEKPVNYVNITGIKAYNHRVNNNDWYIVLNVDKAAFSLPAVVSLGTTGVTVDGAAASGWFQATTGTLEFNIVTDKAEHAVIIPAGTVLGEYVLEKDYVFYTHANGEVDNEKPVNYVNITGISGGYNNQYIVYLNTDQAYTLTANQALTIKVDGADVSVWLNVGETHFISGGSAITMGEHTVVIPAGTVLGDSKLAADFTFQTHADGSVSAESAPDEPVEKTISITGISGGYNNQYIVYLNTDQAYTLTANQALTIKVDGADVSVWLNVGETHFISGGSAIAMGEHTVVIPAGTVLGDSKLAADFTFQTHADGSVSAESGEPEPDEPGPGEPEGKPVSITGIGGYNFRDNSEDWYIILNVDNAAFSLSSVVSLETAGVTVDGAATTGWFQTITGTLEFDLDTDKADHKVVLPAGMRLGEYTLKEAFVFYTYADGTVRAENGGPVPDQPGPGEPAGKPVSITGIRQGMYRSGESDWFIVLDTDIADFALTAISGIQAPVDDTTAQVWFQINSQLSIAKGSFALTLTADKTEHAVTIPAGTKLGGYTLKEEFVFYTLADGTVDTCLRDLREQKYTVQDVSELKLGLSEFALQPGVQLIGDAKQGTNIAIQAIVSINKDAEEFNFGFSKTEGMWDGAGWQVWLRPKYNKVFLAHGETDWQATGHYEFTETEFRVQIGTVDMHEYINGVDKGLYCRKIFLKINGEEVLSYRDTDLSRKFGKKLFVLNSKDAVDGKLISLVSKGVVLRELKPKVYDYYDLTGFAADTVPGGKTILLGETQNKSNVAVRMKMKLSGEATEVRLALAKQQGDNFWDEAGSGWQVWLRPKWDTAYIAHGANDFEVIKPFPHSGTYTVEMGVRDVIIEKNGKKIGNYCRRVYLLVNGEEIASWEDMNFKRPLGNCVMLLTSQDSPVSLSTMKKTVKLPVETIVNGKAVGSCEFVDVISQVVAGKPSKVSVLYHSDYNNKVTLKGLYWNGTPLQPIESEDGKQVYSLEAPEETDQLRVELEVKKLTVDEPVRIFDLFDTSGKASVEVKGKHYGVSLGAMVGPEGQAEVNSAVRFRLKLPKQFNQVPIGILGDVSTLWGNSGALFQITPNQVHFCHPASMTRLASFASSWFAPGSNVCVELGIVKCYENDLYRYDRWYIKAGKTEETMQTVAWYDSVERGHYGGHFSCNGTDLDQSYFLYSLKDIYTITDASSAKNQAQLRTYARWGENVPELYYPGALEGYSDVAAAPKVGVISFFTKPGTKLTSFIVNKKDVTKDVQLGADGAYCYTVSELESNLTFAYEIAEDSTQHTVTVEAAPELEAAVDQTQVLTGGDVVLTVTAQKGYVPKVMANGTDVTQKLYLDPQTGIWTCTFRSIRSDTRIQVEAIQRSYTLSVQENEYATLTLGGDAADGKLPFGGTLELTVQIADGYYVEYIMIADQKLSVDENGKVVLSSVYLDLQELVVEPVVCQASGATAGQTALKTVLIVCISACVVCVLAVVAGGFLRKQKTKRRADENEAK